MTRKFPIKEFPQDRIFVLLNNGYRTKLFRLINEKYGFVKFNSEFFQNQLKYSTFKQWQRGKRGV